MIAMGLRVLELARLIVDDINGLLDQPSPRLISRDQLREAAGSIAWNIREGFGRARGRDRNRFLYYARASAEEADEQLRGNFASRRLAESRYWRVHHRITVV